MLDTRRLPIRGLDGWEVDARCRIFRSGAAAPVLGDWPFVTLEHHDLTISIRAPEAAALAFLGEDGCSDIYRRLALEEVSKGNAATKAIAIERGISEWIVIEAARRHHSQFRLSAILQKLRWGQVDNTMKLQRIDNLKLDDYIVFGVPRRKNLHDHILVVSGRRYRSRRSDEIRLAKVGDNVSFSYRTDPEGGQFIVNSSFSRQPEEGEL